MGSQKIAEWLIVPTGGTQWGTMNQVIENVGQDGPTQVFFD